MAQTTQALVRPPVSVGLISNFFWICNPTLGSALGDLVPTLGTRASVIRSSERWRKVKHRSSESIVHDINCVGFSWRKQWRLYWNVRMLKLCNHSESLMTIVDNFLLTLLGLTLCQPKVVLAWQTNAYLQTLSLFLLLPQCLCLQSPSNLLYN